MADQPDIAKIKRNIEKMIGLGAPEADIDAYIAGEGVTLDQLKAPVMQPKPQPAPLSTMEPRSAGDMIGRQLGLTGRYIAEGGMAFPNMIGDAANTAINMGIRGVNAGIDQFRDNPQEPIIPYLMKPSEATKGVLDAAGAPKPETGLERIVAEPSKFIASLPAFGGAGQAMAKYGPEAFGKMATLAENYGTQLAGATAGGGAYGVTKEAFPDSPAAQMASALVGGAVGGAGAGAVANRLSGPAAQAGTTIESLKAAANQAYQVADDAGVIIKPDAIKRLASTIQDDLAEFGYHPQLQPRIATVLNELGRVSEENITSKGVQTLRRIAGAASMSADPSERALGGRIVTQIDEMMGSLTPDDVVQGNAQQASEALKEGAELWKRMRKSELLNEKEYTADLRASSSGSGGNQDNAVRQNIRTILSDPKKRRQFTADEQAAMEKVVKGGPLQDLLRNVGKLSPQGSGLMSGIGILSSSANPSTAPIFLGGILAKKLADNMTVKNVERLNELVLSGGNKGLLSTPQEGISGSIRGLLSTVPPVFGTPR